MSLAGFLAPSAAVLVLLLLCAPPPCHGAWSHNITGVLAAYPEFSAFSAALSATGVAAEVDNRTTITVLAVDDAAMAAAQAQGLQPEDLKRAVSLHVLLDYFDDAKLGALQGGFAQSTSLFQASGKALGSAGIVNITTANHKGGRVRVAFAAEGGAPAPAVFVYEKTVHASPYDIAVLKVSALISSSPAPAPASAPATPGPAAPATAPATAAPAPVVAPATAPIPRRRPRDTEPEIRSPAPSPDEEDTTPADQQNNGARGTASWTLGAAVAAAVPAMIVLLL